MQAERLFCKMIFKEIQEMKKLTFLVAVLLFGLPLLGQTRVPVMIDEVILEEEPPQALDQLIASSDTAAVVRIDEKRLALNSKEQVVVLYTTTVTHSLRITDTTLAAGQRLEFAELGGAFDNGRWIRQGYMGLHAGLEIGASYVVFLNHTSKTERNLNWGKFGAFEILSGAVLPVCGADQALYKEVAGLRLEDFVSRAEDAAKARGTGNASKNVR